jgi:hypothetical protein
METSNRRRNVWFSLVAILGAAAGFIGAGLSTEIVEEFRFGSDAHTSYVITTALKTILTGAAIIAAAWGAIRMEGLAWGAFLTGVALSIPTFFAFLESGVESGTGKLVTAALAWAVLLRPQHEFLRRSARTVAIPLGVVGFFTSGVGNFADPLALISAFAFTAVAWAPQFAGRPIVATFSIATLTILYVILVGPEAVDQTRSGRLWPFLGGLVGMATLVVAGVEFWWQGRRQGKMPAPTQS